MIILVTVLVLFVLGSFYVGRSRSLRLAQNHPAHLHSQPIYYGYYVALWCGVPALATVTVWLLFETGLINALILPDLPEKIRNLPPQHLEAFFRDMKALATGGTVFLTSEAHETAAARYTELQNIGRAALTVVSLALAIAGTLYARTRISLVFRARNRVERIVNIFLLLASTIAILTTIGIVLSLIFESIRFFARVPIWEFLFGIHWSPQMALREDQVGSSGAFGAIPVFTGTLLITAIAMALAVPVGLMSAIYLSDYASHRFRTLVKPALEILAGVPTVVYGFFAALTIAPFIRGLGESIGLDVASESALAAGLVMGVMIIPFISSLSDDVINAVPQAMRDGSYGLGATRSETIRQVILPAALPGIVGSVLLAVSRAIGETMIVVMAAGLAANLTANPLQAVTTVTVQIVTLLVGDQEFDSAKTLAAFALGLTLFCVTLVLNIVALRVVEKYREQYD